MKAFRIDSYFSSSEEFWKGCPLDVIYLAGAILDLSIFLHLAATFICGEEDQKPVLMINVGPKISKKQSDICQKSVRKLSVTKFSQKTVRNVSDISQKTVSCKNLSELCLKRFGIVSEMCQISIMSQKTVIGFICKTVRILSEISLLTDF